ncbi:MAG: glycosyltransferase [Candidatus Omnitrophota bacterium]|jgi:glycosyltransferase involved in cell wall biosynthesis
MHKVSLYIPCFNAEKTIRECLDGVMQQSYPIDEILIIDDGSQDKTVDIVSQYPVKIIRNGKNKGLAASRNTSFRQARNEFVAALDADCLAHSDWLKQLMDCFEDEDIAGAGGTLVEKYTDSAADRWRALHMSQEWGKELIENPPFLYGSNTVFRKSILQSISMYNELFRNNYEDVNLSFALYAQGFRLIYNPKSVVEHLRKDTLTSVLSTYWHWQYYRNIKFLLADKFFRRLTAGIVTVFDFINSIGHIFRQDWQKRDYELIFIDIIAVFYYPWIGVKYYFQKILSRIIKI